MTTNYCIIHARFCWNQPRINKKGHKGVEKILSKIFFLKNHENKHVCANHENLIAFSVIYFIKKHLFLLSFNSAQKHRSAFLCLNLIVHIIHLSI